MKCLPISTPSPTHPTEAWCRVSHGTSCKQAKPPRWVTSTVLLEDFKLKCLQSVGLQVNLGIWENSPLLFNLTPLRFNCQWSYCIEWYHIAINCKSWWIGFMHKCHIHKRILSTNVIICIVNAILRCKWTQDPCSCSVLEFILSSTTDGFQVPSFWP